MGIIQKQALKSSIVHFLGAGFGAITRLSMPIVLTEAQIGLIQLLDAISGFFVTIFSLGYVQILSMLFPKYRSEENGHHGFLVFGVLLSLLGIFISWLLYWAFGDLYFGESASSKWFKSFAFLVFPLIFFRIIFRNLDGYVRMLFNTVLGVFLESFINKVLLFLGLVCFALSWINFEYFVYFFSAILSLPGIIIIIYSFSKSKRITMPSSNLLVKDNRKLMTQYSLFGIFTGVSGSIVLYVDSLMVNKMISIEALGIYSTFYFAARLLVIPSLSINRISTVVIAESWKRDDKENIQDVYKKSCLNQLLLGAFLFGVGWACMTPVLGMTDKLSHYAEFKYVFFFLGLGLLIEMATGVNASIISTSKKYRYETYFNVALAVFVIIFNYFLIKTYDIVGAALASMLAMVIINTIRWWFLKRQFGLQPFDIKFFKAVVFSAVYISLACLIDYDAPVIYKILINGAGFTILFWSFAIGLKLSPDINNWLLKIKKSVFKG